MNLSQVNRNIKKNKNNAFGLLIDACLVSQCSDTQNYATFHQRQSTYLKKYKSNLTLYSGQAGLFFLSSGDAKLQSMLKIREKDFMQAILARPSSALKYDLADGWVGVGMALMRLGIKKNKTSIKAVLEKILEQRVKTHLGRFWLEQREGKLRIDLGLPHGLLCILNFLSLCYCSGIKKTESLKAAKEIVSLLNKIYEARGYLPSHWPELSSSQSNRVAWCYGSLSYGYCLTLAGLRFQNAYWQSAGKKAFIKAALRTGPSTKVSDPFLCHGSSGVYHMCSRFYDLTEDRQLLPAIKYWKNKTKRLYKKYNQGTKANDKKGGWFYNSLGVKFVFSHTRNSVDPHWDSLMMLSHPSRNQIA